jgi:ketosteroid isomerase-like protein
MIRAVLLLALILATASPASAQNARTNGVERVQAVASAKNTAEKEIRDLLEQSVREALSLESATAQSQIATFERNYARDYMSVGSNGTVYTLTDILKEIREKGPNKRKFSSVEMQDTQLRIHGDTAVATYVMRYSEQRADGAFNSSIRESAVFVRRDGRWLRILEQRSNLNAPR